jgi:hypothetical protein
MNRPRAARTAKATTTRVINEARCGDLLAKSATEATAMSNGTASHTTHSRTDAPACVTDKLRAVTEAMTAIVIAAIEPRDGEVEFGAASLCCAGTLRVRPLG